MDKIRVIGFTHEDGTEQVYFTSDDVPASEFCIKGCKVIYDVLIEDTLPSLFPRERTLHA